MPHVSVFAWRGERASAAEGVSQRTQTLADPATFAALYDCYRHRVYAYLRSRARTEEDAADLTQEVFLRALRGIPNYRGPDERLGAWLFTIARNTANDYHRATRATVPWDFVPEALQPQAEPCLESVVLRREDIECLRALLLSLKPEKRELLALKFGASLTVPEIAAVLGKTEAAIKKQLARTFDYLRERYREPG